MTVSTARRCVIGLAAPVAAVGLVLAVSMPAAATTVTTAFKNACIGVPTTSIASPIPQVENTAITVTHTTGTNTYNIQASGQVAPSTGGGATVVNLSRFQQVFELANPADISAISVVAGSGVNVSGTPTVTRVNASRVADANGAFVLLNGGGSSTIAGAGVGGTGSNTSAAGLTVSPGAFQLPAIQVTTKAGASDLIVKVDTNGDAAKYGNSKNYYSFLSQGVVSVLGFPVTGWAPTMCIPSDATLTASDIGTTPTLNAGAGALHP